MTLPGRYNVGGFGSYFTSSYNSINYNKSSSFSQDLKNRGYFLTLTTLNRSPRYHTLISTENSSDAEKDSNRTENSTTTSESVSKHESNSELSKQNSFSDLNHENEEREVKISISFYNKSNYFKIYLQILKANFNSFLLL